jgi:drug/metabolite transporter (DMT)-like permease
MCFIFGTTFLAIKIGVDSGLPPFFSAGIRFWSAGILLFFFMLWRRKTTIRLLFQKELVITGIFLTFGTFSTLYWAEQYVTSGVAAVLSATGPIMILILQTVICKQKGSRISMIGSTIGIIGVLLLIFPSLNLEMNTFWLVGCLAIILGEVFYAIGTLFAKQSLNKFQQASPLSLNAIQMMYGGVLLLLLSFVTERGEFHIQMSLYSYGSLFYLVVFGSMIGHSLYYWLVAKTNAVFPSTWLFISPIIALLLGIILYDEPLSGYTALGSIIIIIGTILVNYHSMKGFKKKKIVVQE